MSMSIKRACGMLTKFWLLRLPMPALASTADFSPEENRNGYFTFGALSKISQVRGKLSCHLCYDRSREGSHVCALFPQGKEKNNNGRYRHARDQGNDPAAV